MCISTYTYILYIFTVCKVKSSIFAKIRNKTLQYLKRVWKSNYQWDIGESWELDIWFWWVVNPPKFHGCTVGMVGFLPFGWDGISPNMCKYIHQMCLKSAIANWPSKFLQKKMIDQQLHSSFPTIFRYETLLHDPPNIPGGSVSKPCTPVVHIKIAGKWMFIPLKMYL